MNLVKATTRKSLRNAVPCAALVAACPIISASADDAISETETLSVIVDTSKEPISPGKFQPTWESLKQYQVPDWLRDAKFGFKHVIHVWKHFGEGPASEGAPISARGFNEGKGKPFTPEDVRFTTSKDGRMLYIIVMGWPEKPLIIKSLGKKAGLLDKSISRIELLGKREKVDWSPGDESLTITCTTAKPATEAAAAAAFKLTIR